MASSPGASTPDNTPRRPQTVNRSFTLPPRISPATPRAANAPAEVSLPKGFETLYVHPNVSIIKFTTNPSALSTRPAQSPAGLPWASPTERTIAVGPMQIYSVPSSVGSACFLRCSTLLHTIFPRSNCWCVDGVSKFALRVPTPDTYYRIELPGATEEDRDEVEKLKEALKKVLYYERTPCPFSRGFTVDLPEQEETGQVKKRRRKSLGPAKKWKLEGAYSWKPEGWVEPEEDDEGEASGSVDGSEDDAEDSGEQTPAEAPEPTEEVKETSVQGPSARSRALGALRAVSAPQQDPTQSPPPPTRLRTMIDVDGLLEDNYEPSRPRARNHGALRTFQPIPTDMPPSPPDSSAGLENYPGQSENAVGEMSPLEEAHRANDEGATSKIEESTTTENELPPPEESYRAHHEDAIDSERETEESSTPEDELPPPENIHTVRDEDAEMYVEMTEDISKTEDELPPPEDAHELEKKTEESFAAKDESLPTEEPFRAHDEHALTSEKKTKESPVLEDELPPPEEPFSVHDKDTTTVEDRLPPPKEAQRAHDENAVTPTESSARPRTPTNASDQDPYAAIRRRIEARRSIGGTISFHPSGRSPTSSSSTATSALSRKQSRQEQEAFSSALVKKACAIFLGPPAHLVAIMLKLAARFANGAFGVDGTFLRDHGAGTGIELRESEVAGSFYLRERLGDNSDSDGDEDDFGVPFSSPRRARDAGDGSRERRAWDVD